MTITPSWFSASAPISPTKLAAQGSIAWITDGPTLYYYSTSSSTWVAATKPSTASLTDLSASPDGSVIAVDSTGTYLLSSGSYTALYISAYSTACSAVGDVHSILVVDNTAAVTKSVYSVNTALATGPTKVSTTASLANMWGVGSSGTVYQYNSTSSSWSTVSGKTLANVHASLSSTGALQIVGVDTLGKGWSYNGTSWTTIPTPNVGDKYSSIQAGAGYIWAVLTTGAVYCGHI